MTTRRGWSVSKSGTCVDLPSGAQIRIVRATGADNSCGIARLIAAVQALDLVEDARQCCDDDGEALERLRAAIACAKGADVR